LKDFIKDQEKHADIKAERINKTKYEVENKKKEQILSTKRKMSPGSLKRTHNIDRSVNQQYLIGKD